MKTSKKPNRHKISVAIITLLILAFTAPLISHATAQQAPNSGTSNYPELPGVPDNAVQHNKTDITPVAEMEQVAAGELALFHYRNMTVLMNCTQNCSLVFGVDPTLKPTLCGLSVDSNQTMTLTMNLSGDPFEGEKVMEQTLNFYWGIEPNASIQLKGQLRLYINQTELSHELNREVNASRLTWMFWNRTQAEWEAVPSRIDENGYLVCNTDHFSTWTVAEMQDLPENLQVGYNLTFVYDIFAVVVVVVLGVGVALAKKWI